MQFKSILQFKRPKKNNRPKNRHKKTKGGTLGKSKGGPLVKSNFQGSPPLVFWTPIFRTVIFFGTVIFLGRLNCNNYGFSPC